MLAVTSYAAVLTSQRQVLLLKQPYGSSSGKLLRLCRAVLALLAVLAVPHS